LLDTNILSEPVKMNPNRNVMAMLGRHRQVIATAAPVWHELLFGCERLPISRKREILENYLENVVRRNVDILPYDEPAAQWHARQRAKLTLSGETPSFVDGQIAAIAKVNNMVLVTRNTRDYKLYEGLTILNWYRETDK
jgi:tRNA(fMet)-specific endonuclease VapC